jgi:hypothetical protein
LGTAKRALPVAGRRNGFANRFTKLVWGGKSQKRLSWLAQPFF